MAEADLSKIVSLIMENPELIEKIRGLVPKGEETDAPEAPTHPSERDETETAAPASTEPRGEPSAPNRRSHRRELLHALKPYVSDERGRAIESMLSIADILDMMKSR